METGMPLTGNALQPPDWRWQQALEQDASAGRPFCWSSDAGIRAAKRFCHLWRQCRNESDERILATRMPLVFHAFALYRDPVGVTHAALEARILANEPAASIGHKMAATPEVIRTFESLFCDVRTRLQSPDFIFNHVIRFRLWEDVKSWDYERVWKLFGYLGGPSVLDTVLDSFRPTTRPRSLQEVIAFLAEDTAVVARLQTALAARSVRAGDTATALALLHLKAQGRHEPEEEESPSILLQHVEGFLQELPWITGSEAEKQNPAELAVYESGAAELRAEELLKLGSGQITPGELQALDTLCLPPARPRSEQQGLGADESPLEK